MSSPSQTRSQYGFLRPKTTSCPPPARDGRSRVRGHHRRPCDLRRRKPGVEVGIRCAFAQVRDPALEPDPRRAPPVRTVGRGFWPSLCFARLPVPRQRGPGHHPVRAGRGGPLQELPGRAPRVRGPQAGLRLPQRRLARVAPENTHHQSLHRPQRGQRACHSNGE